MRNKILIIFLYYSMIFMTILVIAGFSVSQSTQDTINNFLFLPVVILLWAIVIQRFRRPKEDRVKTENSSVKNFSPKETLGVLKKHSLKNPFIKIGTAFYNWLGKRLNKNSKN